MKKIGGISALTIGICYALITYLYVSTGVLPDDPSKAMEHIHRNKKEWIEIIALSIATDLFFIPFLLSLFANLNKRSLVLMILGTSFVYMFIIIDLVLTWPEYIQLLNLSDLFKDSLSVDEHTSILSQARSLIEILNSAFAVFSLIFLPSFGILIISAALYKPLYGKISKSCGNSTGLAGIISSIGFLFSETFGIGFVITSVLTLFWLIIMGTKMLFKNY